MKYAAVESCSAADFDVSVLAASAPFADANSARADFAWAESAASLACAICEDSLLANDCAVALAVCATEESDSSTITSSCAGWPAFTLLSSPDGSTNSTLICPPSKSFLPSSCVPT